MRWEGVRFQLADGLLAPPSPDNTVVIENCDIVSGQPNVAFKSSSTKTYRQGESFQGVLHGMRPSTPMGKADGGIEQRR